MAIFVGLFLCFSTAVFVYGICILVWHWKRMAPALIVSMVIAESVVMWATWWVSSMLIAGRIL